ncbi:hypothetical protein DDB_G0294266 [Dictyostelium discoideum AX4]|uniref:Uncharacterized protein n=1 Tax=Dictyostelium discoideum TaxID=44689 RepID=Q54AR3_DICDI|nr:hypothetical protein DDB_G0294266 [Dictyostelium discoideum AX4]EAL60344.1 hypothetical protein DDB_G0294266 [Dictyostelium discoideum AX4]|eukprot:XP_628757.1 hypothetical protein DDB_G0294266 [Dictyostelium discoideum AX4]
MNSSANFIEPNGNVPDFDQSPIQRRTNNNISIGDESFNNLSIGNVLGNANVPNPMENQRIIIRRVPRPTVPPIQETVQIATNPRVTYILEYESLQKVCQSKYYSDGDVSNFFITGIIKQAGGSNEDCTSQNIFARLKFVDSCKTGEEKHWYPDSVPLIKRLISILNDFSSKFDSKAKMRKDAQEAFQFPHSALYLNSSQ